MDNNTVLLILAAALGLWFALVAGRLAVGWLQLQRMRFGPGEVVPADRGEMPADTAAILAPAASRLRDLGFDYAETLLTDPALRASGLEPAWSDLYAHPETGSWASIQVADIPEPGLAAVVSFTTYYPGRMVETVNRRIHQVFPVPPNCEIQDAWSASLEDQWAWHRKRVEAIAATPVEDREEVRRQYKEIRASLFGFWLETGFMEPVGEDWRLTSRGAWRYLRQLMTGNRRLSALPPIAEVEAPDVRLLADLRAWRINEAILRHTAMPWRGKVLWFVCSAILGAVAFGYMTSWETVPILLGVLLFHEFGHALAMRAVGYKGVSVLVLPFLGAVALGRKDDAGPWQKLAVLLAGPLPGLLLAVICLRLGMANWESRGWLIMVGAMALSVNLFNLLPFTPLDGGQIVDTFLFARRPRLRFVFFAASALALIAVGMALGSYVLAGAGLVLAIGMPAALRRTQLLRLLGKQAEPQPVAALLGVLHKGPRQCPPFAQRMQTVRILLPHLGGRAPKAAESLGGLAAYLAAVCLPIGLLWDTGLPHKMLAQFTEPPAVSQRGWEPPDWKGQLANAATPEERWQVLWEAGQQFEEVEDDDEARRRYEDAWAEALKLPEEGTGKLHRLDTRIALARLADPDAATASYAELLPELRDLPAPERGRLADVLEALDWSDPGVAVPERIARLQEAIAVREGGDPSDYRLINDRLRLARVLDAAGNASGAEALLRRNVEAGALPQGKFAAWQLEPVAWFYLAHGKADEAEKLLSQAVPATRHDERMLQSALAWGHIVQGDGQAARQLLEAQLEKVGKGKWSDWERLPLLLDLAHGSVGAADQERLWLQQAAEVSAAMDPARFRAFCQLVRREAQSPEWEQIRGRARLAVVKRLPGVEGKLAEAPLK